jgi:hypothetical protein
MVFLGVLYDPVVASLDYRIDHESMASLLWVLQPRLLCTSRYGRSEKLDTATGMVQGHPITFVPVASKPPAEETKIWREPDESGKV